MDYSNDYKYTLDLFAQYAPAEIMRTSIIVKGRGATKDHKRDLCKVLNARRFHMLKVGDKIKVKYPQQPEKIGIIISRNKYLITFENVDNGRFFSVARYELMGYKEFAPTLEKL